MRRPLVALVVTGLCLTLAVAAWAGNGGVAPPDSATESGSTINELYWIVIGVTAAIFILVEGALLWFIIRFRRKAPDDPLEDGPQLHGNTRLELLWTAIPFLILVAIITVTIVKVPSVQANPKPDDGALVVEVAAHTFYWEYTYPNGVVSVDTLRLPVGRPVRLTLTSPDVVHSWWVNELTGKRDAVPGRTNYLDFTIRRPGVFRGQCAELCGAQHAVMYTTVEAVAQGDFDAWLDQQEAAQQAGTSELGRQTWEGVCAKCHGLDGQGDYGPAIAKNSTLSNKQTLAQLLANGQDRDGVPGFMPPVSQDWPERQLDALIAYLVRANLAPAPAGQEQGG